MAGGVDIKDIIRELQILNKSFFPKLLKYLKRLNKVNK